MRPSTTLSVSQPCAESWATMTPIGDGRHCAACQKTVVDFTLKSDAEILTLLAQAVNGAVPCGRFRAEQLNRPLLLPEPASRWRTWLATALTAGSLVSLLTSKAAAQAPVISYAGGPEPLLQSGRAPAPLAPLPADACQTMTPVTTPASVSEPGKALLVRGVVLDANTKEPLPGATVLIKNTVRGVSTNAAGEFELLIAPEWRSGQLRITLVGYQPMEQSLAALSGDEAGAVRLQPLALKVDSMVLGGLAVGVRITPAPWRPIDLLWWK